MASARSGADFDHRRKRRDHRHSGRRMIGRDTRERLGLLGLALLLVSGLGAGPSAGIASAGTVLAGDPTVTSAGPSAAVAATPGPTKPGYSRLVDDSAVLQPRLVGGSARRTVFVQLAVQSASATWAAGLARNDSAPTAARNVARQRVTIQALSIEVSRAAKAVDPGAVTIFRVANAVPGLGLMADPAALRALGGRKDIVAISEIVPKSPANAGAAQLTRVLQTWTDLALTGRGVRVGVIDTGIDYTHADFGGPGTTAAYQAARSTDTSPWQPTAKVVGGYDFVGDDYSADAQPIPVPDGNPLDCNGHGTHVAGTIAGQGVDGAGRTFRGDYGSLTGAELSGMSVAPGMAPGASLYSFKVFGCAGTTDAVIPALDRSLDPNGDGNFSDRLDVVDLSLAGVTPSAQDPENTVLDAIARFGVVPVVAVGNGGDQTDAASSQAASVRSITVASSVDAYQQLDGLRARMPGGPSEIVAGQVSQSYPWTGSGDTSGEVVSLSPDNADGCAPLSAPDRAGVAGKVVWLTADDNYLTRGCDAMARSADVRSAGAVGVLISSDTPVFAGVIVGDPGLPAFQLTPTSTAMLQGGVDKGLRVTFSADLIGKKPEIDSSITDLIGQASARGPHAVPGVIKPDVSAPGDTISSAQMGSGGGSAVRSGTSMAAAEIAGVAALVRQARPAWTAEQVKAAVMNTADHDLYSQPDQAGPPLGPDRVGSGRVDAEAAVSTRLLAYSSTTPGAVSVSFGVVPADVRQTSVTVTAAVVVQNTGTSTSTLAIGYRSLSSQPGVSYQVTPSTMTLTAGSSALATVTMTVLPAGLRHTLDESTPAQQMNPLTGLDEARQYVSAASGRLELTTAGAPDLRVPVYGAAKPESFTTAADGSLAGAPAVVLSGQGFSLSSPADPLRTTYSSLVSVLDLGYRSSAMQPDGGRFGDPSGGDLEAVGAGRTPADASGPGYLWFGLSTYGDWSTIGRSVFPTVDIDTDGDNTADFTVQVQAVGGDSDLLYAMLFDDRGGGSLIGIHPVNFNLGNVDTNVFDSSVLLIPIDPLAIGYRAADASFPIRYSVATYSAYGAPQNQGTVDTTPAITFDVAQPKIITAAPLWQDQGGAGIGYRLAPGASSADALVLHLHGAPGSRSEVITLSGSAG